MLETVLQKLNEYNLLVSQADEPYSSLYMLSTGDKSDPAHVAILESKIGTALPLELKDFYNSMGNIKSNGLNENNSIDIFSTGYLSEKLESSDTWDKIFSLGLLDMIKFSWGNDRYEIDELTSKIKDYINSQYICFGWFRTGDNLESANYLYFDKKGKFGSAFYHQDDFESFFDEEIKPMLNGNFAVQTFGELVVDSMDTIITLKKEELEQLKN